MNELLNFSNTAEWIMIGLVVFSSFWIFLFNYRQDHKEKYNGHWPLIALDLLINMGMSVTGYMLILIVFTNVDQLQGYKDYHYPIGYLFGLTSNVSIPIVLKWFGEQITKKLNEVGKGK